MLALGAALPVHRRNPAGPAADRRLRPGDGLDGRDARLHDDGARPQRRRRLCRPARPRLRRVLRGRGVRRRLARVAPVRGHHLPLRLGAVGRPAGHPHLHVARSRRRRRLHDGRRDRSSACRRFVCAATTSRSSRSGSARSSRSSSGTPTRFGGFDLTNGTFGIAPDRLARVRRLRVPRAVEQGRPLLLDRDRARALHGLLLRPAARLAARPRVDRDPRGRDRCCRDGRSAHADEDLVVRDRRVLRRRRGRLLRELPGSARSRRTSTSTFSVFLLCMVILGGMGSIWGVFAGGHDPRLPEHRGSRDDRLEDPGGRPRLRPDEVPVRDLRGRSSSR